MLELRRPAPRVLAQGQGNKHEQLLERGSQVFVRARKQGKTKALNIYRTSKAYLWRSGARRRILSHRATTLVDSEPFCAPNTSTSGSLARRSPQTRARARRRLELRKHPRRHPENLASKNSHPVSGTRLRKHLPKGLSPRRSPANLEAHLRLHQLLHRPPFRSRKAGRRNRCLNLEGVP